METKNKGQTEEQENLESQTEEAVEETEELPAETDELTNLKEELLTAQDNCLRVVAEYDNFRKRTQKEMATTYLNAVADTVKEFLEVSDNLARAKEAAETAESSSDDILKGLTLIADQFEKAFDKLQVKEINPINELFNPNEHNAVMHIDDDSVKDNTVVEVFQKGYKIGDRVLRYAMVKVAN